MRLKHILISCFLLIIGLVTFETLADAALCQNKTAIVYGNGMLNSWDDANDSKKWLEKKMTIYLQTSPSAQFMTSELEFHLAYNSNNGGGVVGGLQQLMQVYFQKQGDNMSVFFRWVGGVEVMPAWFKLQMDKIAIVSTAATFINNASLQTMLNGDPLVVAQNMRFDGYKYLLGQGKRVLMVSHSQGNFYANAVYNALAGQYANSIGNVQVATPASYVASGGTYTTVPEDLVMAFIPGKLPPSTPVLPQPNKLPLYFLWGVSQNFTQLGQVAWSNATHGHAFVTWYLAGNYTRNRIIGQIVTAIPQLTFPVKTITNVGPITVTLWWAHATDVDLHVFEPGGFHVYYRQRIGVNGRLDRDNTVGFGPEHYYVSCTTLQAGTYTVGVNYYSGVVRPEVASVQIKAGIVNKTFTKSLATSRFFMGDMTPTPVAKIVVTNNPNGGFDFAVQ